MSKLQTVVELPEFIKRAKALISDDDRMALTNILAVMPDAGISLGGLRKVRFSREGGGKRGGYKTLYVFGGSIDASVFPDRSCQKRERQSDEI